MRVLETRVVLTWVRARLPLVALLAAYGALRVVVLVGARAHGAPDSPGYGAVSFLGHAPRLWGVPLFYAIFPDEAWRVVGQWLVGTLAWAGLAAVLWSIARHTAAKVAGATAVVLLALVQYVGALDFMILSESLSVSLGVVVLAGMLSWSARGRPVALVVAVVAAFWWTFTRPDIRVFTLLLVAVLAGVAVRAPARRRAALLGAGTLLAAVGWCSVILPSTSAVEMTGITSSDEKILQFRLLIEVMPDPDVRRVFVERFGMPRCAGAERAAVEHPWDIYTFADAYRECPDLVAWTRSNGTGVYHRLALVEPETYLRLNEHFTALALAGGADATVPAVLPGFVTRLVFPRQAWVVAFTLGLLVAAVLAAVLTRARRGALLSGAVLTAGLSLVSLGALVATAGGATYWRLGIQESIGLRLAMVLFVVAAIDAWRDQRRAYPAPV